MSSSTICEACLSTNRKLTLVSGNDRQAFTNILDNADYVSDPLALCWECTAIIRKVIRFKRQVQNAHRLLISSMLRQTKLLHSLSNLSRHTNTSESHILLSENTECLSFNTKTGQDNVVYDIELNETIIHPSPNYRIPEGNTKSEVENEIANVLEREPVFIKVELENENNFEQELETTADLDTPYDHQDVTNDYDDGQDKIVVKSDPMESHEELSSESDADFNDSDEEPLKKKKKIKHKGAKKKNKTVPSDTEPLDISASEFRSDELVDPQQYTIDLKKYYSAHDEKSKKTEWTSEKINRIIRLIRECYISRRLGRKPTNSQYHYAKKYDVISVDGNKKALIVKRKTSNDPIIQYVPSSEYHRLISEAHIASNHGRRDKILRSFKNKYMIPVFAVTAYLRLCKVCTKKRSLFRGETFSEPLRYNFNEFPDNSDANTDSQVEDPTNTSNNSDNFNNTNDFTVSMEVVNISDTKEIKMENVADNENNTESSANEITITFEKENVKTCHFCKQVSASDVCSKCKTFTQGHENVPTISQDLLVPMYEMKQFNEHPNGDIYVDRNEFNINIQKYYSGHKEMSKKTEWSYEKIQNVIKLIQEFHRVRALGLKPSRTQYHHASKYDVISANNKKVLIIKRKSISDPVIQIVPSNEYYNIILDTHLATHHGRRDKITKFFKNKYIVPKFAIMMFLQLCKTCVNKKYPFRRSKKFVDPLTCDFSDIDKLISDNEQDASNASS